MSENISAERKWRPPETVGWLFLAVDIKPQTAEDIIPIAIEMGLELEEIDVVAAIAGLDSFNVNPFVVITEGTVEGYDVEVIVPPERDDMFAVYRRYND